MRARHCIQDSRLGPVVLGLDRFLTTAKRDRGLSPIWCCKVTKRVCQDGPASVLLQPECIYKIVRDLERIVIGRTGAIEA